MVYHGPSTGCLTCRRRKVRCNKERPSCSNCIKRKQTCPGYENVFDTKHRDQTQAVTQRLSHRHNNRHRDSTELEESITWADIDLDTKLLLLGASSPSSPDPPPPASAAPSLSLSWGSGTSFKTPSPLSFSIPIPLELTAVEFFFTNFSRIRADPEATYGFMPFLPQLYAKAPADGPLQAATASVSTNMLSLFLLQGNDTEQARSFYAKAVSNVKYAIAQSDARMDEVILAILILGFYEELTGNFGPDRSRSTAHKQGAVALIVSRGKANFHTPESRRVTAMVRNALCEWAVDNAMDVPDKAITIFSNPLLPCTTADRLDIVTLQVFPLFTRFRNTCAVSKHWHEEVGTSEFEALLDEALQCDAAFEDWMNTIPLNWNPEYVGDEVLQSIRDAGMYGNKCAVYQDLYICDVVNRCRDRRLTLLQMIQRCCLLCPSEESSEIFVATGDIMQKLVDDICESVPFFVGDAVATALPTIKNRINYPYTYRNGFIMPDPSIDHPRQAMASGGWIIYCWLTKIVKLMRPIDGSPPLRLRAGQLEWIRGQMQRLEIVYTFMPNSGALAGFPRKHT